MSVPVKKAMGIYIHPDFWLGDDGRSAQFILGGKEGHPKAEFYNKILLNKKREIDRILEEIICDKGEISVPVLRSVLNGTYEQEQEQQKGKVSFVDEVLKYNQAQYQNEKISFSVWENIKCNMGAFRKFLRQVKRRDLDDPKTTFHCTDMTVELMEEYIAWRKERGNTNDTINKALTPIFKALKKMMRLGWVRKEVGEEILEMYLPTRCKSLSNPTEVDVDYLTSEQVKQLIKLTAESKYPRTKELVDMFLFSIHCGGMRFSDVCTLRWVEVNFEQMIIRHLQVKNHTKRPVVLVLPISGECLKILKRWEGRFDNFVYGLLPDEFDLDNMEQLKFTVNSRNRTMNQSLLCMGEKMKLPFRLHFHIARHTFASMALNRGVDLKVISYLMGHSSTLVTEKVYAKLFPQTLTEVVNEKLDFNFDD